MLLHHIQFEAVYFAIEHSFQLFPVCAIVSYLAILPSIHWKVSQIGQMRALTAIGLHEAAISGQVVQSLLHGLVAHCKSSCLEGIFEPV